MICCCLVDSESYGMFTLYSSPALSYMCNGIEDNARLT